MNRYFLRAITITLATFLLGTGVYYLTRLETSWGLDSLFQIRGVRTPPSEVVIVAMDEKSQTRLNLNWDLPAWRGLHAELTKELQRQGVLLIVFDLQFMVSQPDYDAVFAAAMHESGNVMLTDCLQTIQLTNAQSYSSSGGEQCSADNKIDMETASGQYRLSSVQELDLIKAISPVNVLAKTALSHEPFILQGESGSPVIREVWTFIDDLRQMPTLPLVAWFYYLQRNNALPNAVPVDNALSAWLAQQRRECSPASKQAIYNPSKNIDLTGRISDVLCRGDSRYLDYYGPPQTLRMESYSDVYGGKVSDLRGKVVFVGKANRSDSGDKKDSFITSFTDEHSGMMFGVEIMATQFANLLEGRFVESPVPPVLLLLSYGLVIGMLLAGLTGFYGIGASVLLTAAYAGLAIASFKAYGWWLPVAVPVLIQFPSACFMSLQWSRRDLLNERKRILAFVRQVFPQWLPFVPASPGRWYPEQGSAQLMSERDVSGLCLATDIEGYTSVAAQHPPHEMWELLKAYYQVLGHPVSTHKGIIANIQGDAMMALWIDLPPDSQRHAACLAALEIGLAVEQFNSTSNVERLPTRIGLHEGDMVLGSGESGGFRFYNPFGDTLNTASRIQGVNKYLGTRILASAAIAKRLTNIISRPVGSFRVVGKNEPLELAEIIGKPAEISDSKMCLIEKFADSLAIFQQGKWQEAASSLQGLLDNYGDDGPTRYFLAWACTYQQNPPLEWDGIINLETK